MRLCFVGPAASVNLRRWVEWFAMKGHDTTVITVEPVEPALAAKFRQVDLCAPLAPRKLGRFISAARMAAAVRRVNPDVVHVHYVRGLAWGMLLGAARPYVATPWGSDVLEEQGAFREWYSKSLTGQLMRRAALITVHSSFVEHQVRRLFPGIGRMCRVGWGVDLRLFRPGLDVRDIRERWGIEEGRRVVFSPRLAQPFYNHERIIRALPAVCERVPETLLVLRDYFGDPGYVAELRKLSADLGVEDRVKFLGDVPYDELPLWYNLADAVVMLPRSDGMPSSLLEAMACGTVPILSRLPQYDEIIQHGENGYLVGTAEKDLVALLVQVLSDWRNRADIARRNRFLVEEIADQDREMSRMEEEYRRLAQT